MSHDKVYADTDFFLALLKPSDWLKENAREIYNIYRDKLTTSEITFVELLLLAKRYDLDYFRIVAAVAEISNYTDTVPFKAAKYIEDGANVFDAFHAVHCNDRIISSDHIFDKLGVKRIKLESFKVDSKKK